MNKRSSSSTQDQRNPEAIAFAPDQCGIANEFVGTGFRVAAHITELCLAGVAWRMDYRRYGLYAKCIREGAAVTNGVRVYGSNAISDLTAWPYHKVKLGTNKGRLNTSYLFFVQRRVSGVYPLICRNSR